METAAAVQNLSLPLRDLIKSVRQVVQTEDDSAKVGATVADLLRPCLHLGNFLRPEQVAPCDQSYRQHILHVEPDGSFSVVSLVWMPGQTTPIHDHVSWCVIGVYRGQEHETVYELAGNEADQHLVVTGHAINPIGSVASLIPPGDVHHVENAGQELAVSLHVYGADISVLGSSIRRRYKLEVRQPVNA